MYATQRPLDPAHDAQPHGHLAARDALRPARGPEVQALRRARRTLHASIRALAAAMRKWSVWRVACPPTLSLADDFAVKVFHQRPLRWLCVGETRLACVDGSAWITAAGDARDIVLQRGEAHRASSGERLFINGMPECELRITSADQGASRDAFPHLHRHRQL